MKNKYFIEDNVCFIEIQSPKYSLQLAIIDVISMPVIESYRWSVLKRPEGGFYALGRCKGSNKRILMHKLLTDIHGLDVDHKDGNSLNNRLSNLRAATRSQNSQNSKIQSNNSTGFKGIWPIKETGRYRAAINLNRKRIYLGCFKTKEEAAIAYNKAAALYFGEFAKFNNISTIEAA